jgi:iron complex outermembrane receptor protein
METPLISANTPSDTTARAALLLMATLATTTAAPAQDDAMEPIVITAPRIERNLLDVPAAVDAVDRDEIRTARRGLTLDESLQQVPGLYFQNQYNFAQGLRISTRGFGARAPFGIRGIRLRVDGFPETLPDGQSQTDAIDLASAERIEVIRGPAAVAYGNAAGGVIDVTTADGRNMAYSPSVSAQVGSYGYYEGGIRAGGSDDRLAHHISASAMRYDGFREQSRAERARVNAKVTRSFAEGRELQTVLTLLENPVSEDPGGLTATELENDRDSATDNAVALDSGQKAAQQRLGVRWRDTGAAGGTLTLRGFYSRRDFEQQLPFPGSSLLGYDRDFFGIGTDYARSSTFSGMPLQYTIGGEMDRQIDDRFRFAVDGTGTVQSRTADERQQATAGGLFAQADLGVTEALDLSAGVRFDRVRFEIDDDLTADGDDSGARRFDETSGSLGALYALSPDHRLYANVSTAFETPTFTEFADPDGTGGFNPAIEPQQALNREIGARGRLGRGLRYQIALFRVDVDDEIVSFERNGRDFFENAARTRRDGLELGLDWIATERITVAAAWTWSDYRFERFVDREGNDFSGNRLPGLPEHKLFIEADWRAADGRYARAGLRYVDSVYADNANRVRVDDYATLDLRAGRVWSAAGRRVEAWFGIDNVTDTEHVANVRVNATAGRYFEPAPGRMFLAGLEVGF